MQEFCQCWVLNVFGAGVKFDAGADENHEINFHRPKSNRERMETDWKSFSKFEILLKTHTNPA